jgi:hypothetical protein
MYTTRRLVGWSDGLRWLGCGPLAVSPFYLYFFTFFLSIFWLKFHFIIQSILE